MAKGSRDLVILECTEARAAGASPSRYYTSKNKKRMTEKAKEGRIEMMKYNPFMRKHTLHREVKK